MTPWTVACQAPLSMGSSRLEYWSGLPYPSPGDLFQVEFFGGFEIAEVIDISPSNLDSSLFFLQPSVSHDVLCI